MFLQATSQCAASTLLEAEVTVLSTTTFFPTIPWCFNEQYLLRYVSVHRIKLPLAGGIFYQGYCRNICKPHPYPYTYVHPFLLKKKGIYTSKMRMVARQTPTRTLAFHRFWANVVFQHISLMVLYVNHVICNVMDFMMWQFWPMWFVLEHLINFLHL